MKARQVSIGTELFVDHPDTNGPRLAEALGDLGIEVVERIVVGDGLEELTRALERVLESAPASGSLVVTTGGLGPTSDDLTREAIALATGRRLQVDESIALALRARARKLGRPEPGEDSLRQAQVPEGARVLANPAGTAPGLLLSFERAVLLVLPGPPREVAAMQEASLAAALEALAAIGLAPSGALPTTAELRVAGLGESEIAERLRGIAELEPAGLEAAGLELAFLASPGEVRVKLRSHDAESVRAAAAAVRGRLGDRIFSEDRRSLAEVVVGLLAQREESVGTVESCTGGLVAAALTAVPGCSAVLRAGLIVYSDNAKVALAGVSPALLEAKGAVSEETVCALATFARRSLQADWVLAVTGIAGPGGGTDEKPVGTVWTAIAGPDGDLRARLHRFPGSRELVRAFTVGAVLDALRLRLLE